LETTFDKPAYDRCVERERETTPPQNPRQSPEHVLAACPCADAKPEYARIAAIDTK